MYQDENPERTRRQAEVSPMTVRGVGIVFLVLALIGGSLYAVPRIKEYFDFRALISKSPVCGSAPTGSHAEFWQPWDLETARINMPPELEGELCSAWTTKDLSLLERMQIATGPNSDAETLAQTFGLLEIKPITTDETTYGASVIKSARSGKFAVAYKNFRGSSDDTAKIARFITVISEKNRD